MAERVRRDPVPEPCVAGSPLDHRPGCLPAEAAASAGDEEWSATARLAGLSGEPGRPDSVEVADQPFEGNLPNRHEPFLVALADHSDEGAIEREVLTIQVERLA